MVRLRHGLAIFATFFLMLSGISNAQNDSPIMVAGSLGLAPLAHLCADNFSRSHQPGVHVSGGGGPLALALLRRHFVGIANTDEDPHAPDLIDHRVAVLPYVIIANSRVGVRSLSRDQIRGIFDGSISNWSMVGGRNRKIVVIQRPTASLSRQIFERTITGSLAHSVAARTEHETSEVLKAVEETPDAIGYATAHAASQVNVTKLEIDGVPPSSGNVESGRYPFWSFEHMVTLGPGTPAEQEFIRFVSDASADQRQMGFVPMREMRVGIDGQHP